MVEAGKDQGRAATAHLLRVEGGEGGDVVEIGVSGMVDL
jgi:hypothetical protein